MTTTYQIKAYSRTTSDDDSSKLTRFEYNGSFAATKLDISLAFNSHDAGVLACWAAAMDCFYDALFIRADTEETVSFNTLGAQS